MADLQHYITDILREYHYLEGDDCERTRKFLTGAIETSFRLGERRKIADDEKKAIAKAVAKFLKS